MKISGRHVADGKVYTITIDEDGTTDEKEETNAGSHVLQAVARVRW